MVLGASGALWDGFSVFGASSWVMEAVFMKASVGLWLGLGARLLMWNMVPLRFRF